MLKVTFCAYDGPEEIGGTSSWILRLFPLLRDSGVELSCLFLLWDGPGPTLNTLREQGFNCPSILCPNFSAERVSWILEELSKDPPDVFVPNTVSAAYLAIKWIKSTSIRTVGVLHSDCVPVTELQDVFIFGKKSVRLNSVVCVSRELEKQVCARRPNQTLVERIPCGVPIPSEIARTRGDRLRLVYLGRLTEEAKRISQVTEAMCRVVNEAQGCEAVIYGEGPERNRVIDIIGTLNRNGRIQYKGVLKPNLIQNELSKCDVIVLLSDYEGLPVAIMEAMAVGVVPVCLRSCSGVSELVVDGVTGILVDDRADSFINAITKLRNDPGLIERLSRNAREKIASEYGIEACSSKWVRLLNKVHRESEKSRRLLCVPDKIKLGRKLSFLSDPRPHKEAAYSKVYRKARMLAGRIRRQIWQSEKA